MLPERQVLCYVVDCPRRSPTPVIRFIAVFVAAALSVSAVAADKSPRTRGAKVSKAGLVVAVDKDGKPVLESSGVLVLDPTTGQTLYSKNADRATPIASIT